MAPVLTSQSHWIFLVFFLQVPQGSDLEAVKIGEEKRGEEGREERRREEGR